MFERTIPRMTNPSDQTRSSLDNLNRCSREDLVNLIGSVFEHSPWIVELVWPQRPFGSLDDLHSKLCEVVRESGLEKKLTLIRAHPDLVGRAALAGALSPASAAEQASAGLDQLTAAEIEKFQTFNRAYREKFGFPFIICARLNKKEAILRGFEQRLPNSREAEIETALAEIYKIAYLRLQDIVHP